MRRPLTTLFRYLALVALALPVVARAQTPAQNLGATQSDADGDRPWRGSSLGYGHQFSAISLDKSAEPTWNPEYQHRLTLRPEYHFGSAFSVWGQLSLGQELTQSDVTKYKYEPVLSDLIVEGVWSGVTEPKSGIRVGGTLRLMAPTSKASQADELVTAVAPAVRLSRNFKVLGGLNLGYLARVTRLFHGSTMSGQTESPSIDCGDPDSVLCSPFRHSGVPNTEWSFTQSPSLALSLNDDVSFALVTGFTRSAPYELPAYEFDGGMGKVHLDGGQGIEARYSTLVSLSGSWQVTQLVNLSLGAYTWAGQLGPDGTYRNPFVNRFTTVTLDLTLDAERLFALAAGRK